MSGQSVRRRFMKQLAGLSKYPLWMAWGVLAGYVALILAAVGVGMWLLSLPLTWVTGFGMAVVSLFIGTRIRGLNNIVHECSHFSFSNQREDNVRIGAVCTALLTGSFADYRRDHMSHHAHVGDYEKDRDFGMLQALGLHDPLTPRVLLRHAVTPLIGRHLPYYVKLNFDREDGGVYVALKMGTLLAMGIFALVAPLAALLFVLIPRFYVYPTLNYWTDCFDHGGLVGERDELRASRNVIAPRPLELFFFPRNDSYHLIHHLFPHVPARHMKEVHKTLSQDLDYGTEPLAVKPAHRALMDKVLGRSQHPIV